jgi:hypothetical protein
VATIGKLRAAEKASRQLLDREGLPQPDHVEYGQTSIVLLWHDSKTAVVIDVDEPLSSA